MERFTNLETRKIFKMNTIKPVFLWDCEVKNHKRRDMLGAEALEVNFEVNYKFMNRTAKQMQIVLQQSLGLINIRQLPAYRNNTRWVGTIDPAVFMRNLPAWQTFMLICGEQAIAIGWDNKCKGCFEGVLLAQASHAMDWGCFDPALFTRFEVQE